MAVLWLFCPSVCLSVCHVRDLCQNLKRHIYVKLFLRMIAHHSSLFTPKVVAKFGSHPRQGR